MLVTCPCLHTDEVQAGSVTSLFNKVNWFYCDGPVLNHGEVGGYKTAKGAGGGGGSSSFTPTKKWVGREKVQVCVTVALSHVSTGMCHCGPIPCGYYVSLWSYPMWVHVCHFGPIPCEYRYVSLWPYLLQVQVCFLMLNFPCLLS